MKQRRVLQSSCELIPKVNLYSNLNNSELSNAPERMASVSCFAPPNSKTNNISSIYQIIFPFTAFMCINLVRLVCQIHMVCNKQVSRAVEAVKVLTQTDGSGDDRASNHVSINGIQQETRKSKLNRARAWQPKSTAKKLYPLLFSMR